MKISFNECLHFKQTNVVEKIWSGLNETELDDYFKREYKKYFFQETASFFERKQFSEIFERLNHYTIDWQKYDDFRKNNISKKAHLINIKNHKKRWVKNQWINCFLLNNIGLYNSFTYPIYIELKDFLIKENEKDKIEYLNLGFDSPEDIFKINGNIKCKIVRWN